MKQIIRLRSLVAFSILLFFYVPIFFMLTKAFDHEGQVSTFWFYQLFEDSSFWTALKNSFIIALFSSVISVFLALTAVLRKIKNSLLDQFMLLSLTFPEIILALSLLSLFVLIKFDLGLMTMLIGHTTLTLSFSYFILKTQMQKMDSYIIEAAEDLGADAKTILFGIQLPWLKSALLSSFFLSFLLSLDDFLVSFFVSGIGQDTLPIKLFSMLKIGVSPMMNALSFIILSFSFILLIGFYPFIKSIGRRSK